MSLSKVEQAKTRAAAEYKHFYGEIRWLVFGSATFAITIAILIRVLIERFR